MRVALLPSRTVGIEATGLQFGRCDREGEITPCAVSGTPWTGCARLDRPPLMRNVAGLAVAFDQSNRTRPVAVLSAPGARGVVIGCARPETRRCRRSTTAIALALTGLEERIVDGLVLTGDLRRAARCAGVAYETARKVVKSAIAKAGVRRQAELVSAWVSLQAVGEALVGSVEEPMIALFGLTPRQARIADLVARGVEREEAAWRLGISIHVVKAELRAVFETCGVHTQAALAVLTAEVRVLQAVVTASEGWMSDSRAARTPSDEDRDRQGPGCGVLAVAS